MHAINNFAGMARSNLNLTTLVLPSPAGDI